MNIVLKLNGVWGWICWNLVVLGLGYWMSLEFVLWCNGIGSFGMLFWCGYVLVVFIDELDDGLMFEVFV